MYISEVTGANFTEDVEEPCAVANIQNSKRELIMRILREVSCSISWLFRWDDFVFNEMAIMLYL